MSDYTNTSTIDVNALNKAFAAMDLETGPLASSVPAANNNVSNSGLYRTTIREAWLDTRMVQGVSRQVLKVSSIATHIDDATHTGNLFFTIDLITDPNYQYPFAVFLMKSFLCITGCLSQGPNGQSVLHLDAHIERKQNGTERAVVEALKGADLVVAIRRQEPTPGKVFLNPVGFMASDFRSWNEIKNNAAAASEYKHAFTNLVSEGLPLTPMSTGNSTPVAYGAQAVASHAAAIGAQAAPLYNPYGSPAAPAAQASGVSSWTQNQIKQAYNNPGAPAAQQTPAANAAPAYQGFSTPPTGYNDPANSPF